MAGSTTEDGRIEPAERHPPREMLIGAFVYGVMTTILVQWTTNLFFDLALINLVFGGLMIFWTRTHARRAGNRPPRLYYVLALLVPAFAGVLYYVRRGEPVPLD